MTKTASQGPSLTASRFARTPHPRPLSRKLRGRGVTRASGSNARRRAQRERRSAAGNTRLLPAKADFVIFQARFQFNRRARSRPKVSHALPRGMPNSYGGARERSLIQPIRS